MADYIVTKSAAIHARDTTKIARNGGLDGGKVYGFASTIEATTADIAGSVYVFGQIPTNAYNVQVFVYMDAMSSGAVDVGLAANTSVLIPGDSDGTGITTTLPATTLSGEDADFFASATTLASAVLTGTNVTHESGVYGVEDIEKPLWEAFGASADPGGFYDLIATVTTVPGANGTLSVKVTYQL
jgi:hypothetical protein